MLVETKNTTLWISNLVVFPEYNIEVNNLDDKEPEQFVHCLYHPKLSPKCPVFRLGDIIKFTPNANATYEEIAKFGGVIFINMKWDCKIDSFFNSYNTGNICKLTYSFRRLDSDKISSAAGSYRYAHFYEGELKRTFFRTYRIRFVVDITATVRKYDFFTFLTNIMAYSGCIEFALNIFVLAVKHWYHHLQIDQIVDVNDGYQAL